MPKHPAVPSPDTWVQNLNRTTKPMPRLWEVGLHQVGAPPDRKPHNHRPLCHAVCRPTSQKIVVFFFHPKSPPKTVRNSRVLKISKSEFLKFQHFDFQN